MPNLFVHVVIAYFIAVLFRIKDRRLVALGAVLPDISRIIFLSLFFTKAAAPDVIFFYTEPIHTIFFSAIVAAAISFFSNNKKLCFKLLSIGFLSHYVLDFMQIHFGYGQMFFYPLAFEQFGFGLFLSGDLPINLIGILALAIAIFLEKSEEAQIKFSNYNKPFAFAIAAGIVALLLLVSTITKESLIENNVRGLDFLYHPEKYDGKEVNLHDGIVTSENPLKISFLGKSFEVKNINGNVGEIWSVKAVYENGYLVASDSFKYNPLEFVASVVGLVLALLLWVNSGVKLKA